MKTGKHILSIFLAVMMLLSAAPLAGFIGLEIAPKAKALAATGQCGENVYWCFDSFTGTLTISGTGAMTDYEDYSKSPFYNKTDIRIIIIDNGVTTVGSFSFSGCKNVKSVGFPNDLEEIGWGAFYNCSALTSVTIPDSVTSIETGAFSGCKFLKNVTLPKGLNEISDGTFSYCESLESIEIPNCVNRIGSAFNGCTSLKTIELPNSVTALGSLAFYKCCNLTSISLSNNLTLISYAAFANCTSLKSIEIPSSVTTIGAECFCKCSSLDTISIPIGVSRIGNCTFLDCINLKSISIPASLTQIDSGAFSNCSSLMRVNITSIDAWCKIAFENHTANPLYFAHELYLNGTLVEDLTIPNSVTKIGSHVFCGSTSITSVTIPEGVTSIGKEAFSDCSALMRVSIPKSIVSIGADAFNNCDSLMRVDIVDVAAWCAIQFSNSLSNPLCYSHMLYLNGSPLVNLYVPNTVITIKSYAFYEYSGLLSVTIADGVKNIDNMVFYKCTSLSELTIPGSVVNVGTSVFSNCTSLTNVVFLPRGVADINSSTFAHCKALESLTLPNSINYIGSSVFNDCDNLKEVFYNGTKAQWKGLEIEKGNDCLNKAIIHCIDGTIYPTVLLNRAELILSNNKYAYLSATVSHENYTTQDLIWTSSDESVATVENGKVTARREGITFITAKLGNSAELMDECKVIVRGYDSGVYSLGEETYSFINFANPAGGACFRGCFVTSSMFHLGLLDKATLGDKDKALYDYYDGYFDDGYRAPTKKIKEIICFYQGIQGSYITKSLIAGGYMQRDSLDILLDADVYLHPLEYDLIQREWNQVVRYVKNHKYDDKGSLIVGIVFTEQNETGQISSGGQHALAFLRYEVSNNGQDRIYVYNPSAPDKETYLYRDQYGTIKLHGYTPIVSVDQIWLEDIYKIPKAAEEYKKEHAIYASENIIAVENAAASIMQGELGTGVRQVMYEIPDDLTQVRIAPLTDHAEFTYMDQVYTIDREDENTIGILTLAKTDEDAGMLTVINDPDNHVHIYTAELTAEPTCTENGEVTCTCTRCNNTYTETIDALGHYDNDADNICDECGQTMSDSAHTHAYTSTVTKQPTCTAPGVRTYTCTCGASYTETIGALGHAYVNHNAKAPTCTEKGWDAYKTCSRCNYTSYKEKAALGHVDKNNDSKCDRCKDQMTGEGVCPYCGKVHKSFFDKITGFFHKIIYKLTHLFKKEPVATTDAKK